MEKSKIEYLIGENQFKEMIATQLLSWELVLQKKNLSQKTIDRKIKNILDFFAYMNKSRMNNKNKRIKADNMSNLAFEFIRDGYFNEDNIENEGCKNYREQIYYNIMTGINYIYQDYFQDRAVVILPLTNVQREVLEDISKNKFFKVTTVREDEKENFYDNMQVELIKQLGIKVYFDEKNLPYVLSHELAELINKPNNKLMRDIRTLHEKIDNSEESKIGHVEKSGLFSMFEDYYEIEKKVGNNIGIEKKPTYRLYKNLLLMYLLGLTGQEIVEFKIKYIQAFDYIEQKYNELLIEHGKLKESFYNMYNEIRKRNRDLLIVEHNKKVKKK